MKPEGQIYVFGKENSFSEEPKRTFNNTEIYHTTTGKWASNTQLLTAKDGLAAVAINETIYVIGGGREPGLSHSHIKDIFR